MKFNDVLENLGFIKRNLSKKDVFELEFIEKVHPQPHHYESLKSL